MLYRAAACLSCKATRTIATFVFYFHAHSAQLTVSKTEAKRRNKKSAAKANNSAAAAQECGQQATLVGDANY